MIGVDQLKYCLGPVNIGLDQDWLILVWIDPYCLGLVNISLDCVILLNKLSWN